MEQLGANGLFIVSLLSISLSASTCLGAGGAISFDLRRLNIEQIHSKITSSDDHSTSTCVEITRYFLDRIIKYNPKINAVITLDPSGALAQAAKLDSYYAERRELMGRLHCVPTLVKDNILVKGMAMTLGLSYFVNHTMATDAPSVRRLREAGAIILGKANLTPLAMSAPEAASVAGRVWNPHSMSDTTSSSSNGNAAALAARLSVLGLTSDSSGSTTCPATVAHVVGLRPPIDAFDMSGLFPIRGPTHDTMGVMALSVEDTCTALAVLAPSSDGSSTVDYDSWCGNGTRHDPQPYVRVGIVGNLTYGPITVDSSYGETMYNIDAEILPAFRRFESNLRLLANVSVTVAWGEDLAGLYNNVTEHDWDAACDCMTLWMNRFMEENEIVSSSINGHRHRVRNVTGLLRLAFNGSSLPHSSRLCEGALLTEWYCVLYICNFGKWETCNKSRAASELVLRQAYDTLRASIFEKFDVVVFTQNSHQLLSYLDSQGRTMGDIGSSFAYPALAVPIGFSSEGWFRWRSVPVGAYFFSSTDKFHSMMNVAKRYEDRFWTPSMPDGFE